MLETTLSTKIVIAHLDWLWAYCPRAQRRGQTNHVDSCRTCNTKFHLPRNAGSRLNEILVVVDPKPLVDFIQSLGLSQGSSFSLLEGETWGHNWLWWFYLRDGEELPLEFWINVLWPCSPFFVDFYFCNSGKFIYCCKTVIGKNHERVYSSCLSNHRCSQWRRGGCKNRRKTL